MLPMPICSVAPSSMRLAQCRPIESSTSGGARWALGELVVAEDCLAELADMNQTVAVRAWHARVDLRDDPLGRVSRR